MFTGIIQAIGSIEKLEKKGGDVRLTLNTAKLPLNDADLGDSIAVNGVCLTAIEYTGRGFVADVSAETLSKTSLGALKQGSPVNLEKSTDPEYRPGGAYRQWSRGWTGDFAE